MKRTRRTLMAAGAAGAAVALLAGCTGDGGGGGTQDGSAISVYIDSDPSSITLWEALVEAYAEVNPDVAVELDMHPSGGEGDNLVRTRLATGEMNDLFWYNSGSLMQALSPDQTLLDLSDQPWVSAHNQDFVDAVATDDGVYGAAVGFSFAGAMNYNKDIYAELGLDVPVTWDEFMSNNAAIADAGYAPVIQTFGDAWTAQLFVLGNFYNVSAEQPDWAAEYTEGDAKFVDAPEYGGFTYLEELHEAGYLNENFASATYEDGVRQLAEGEGAHYPMLTNNVAPALSANHSDAADSVGVFPIPGTDAASNGLTMWMPNGVYVPQTTEGDQLDATLEFIEWLVTPESCDVQASVQDIGGPFVIDGCELPSDVSEIVADMQAYVDAGDTGLALEFLSPIKGPALEQIAVEVGSGIRDAASGAALYDQDVEQQADQLGLDWD